MASNTDYCPHCGSKSVQAVTIGIGFKWAVLCNDCGARGPEAKTDDAAWRWWKMRAMTTPDNQEYQCRVSRPYTEEMNDYNHAV